ncbi:MAG: hypothetical protein MJE77_05835 [Proteobacteria bacterium]|nr:hypothetical protein [Pseudomonadota bacterium]
MTAISKQRITWHKRAVQLAEKFAATRMEAFQDPSISRDNLRELRDEGLTRLLLPSRLEGLAMPLSDSTEIIRAIARGCPDTGVAFAVHTLFTAVSCVLEDSSTQATPILEAVRDGALLWGPVPYPAVGNRPVSLAARAGQGSSGDSEREYELQGKAHVPHGFSTCTHVVVIAARQSSDSTPTAAFVLARPRSWAQWADSPQVTRAGQVSGGAARLIMARDDLLAVIEGRDRLPSALARASHFFLSAVLVGFADYAFAVARGAGAGRSARRRQWGRLPGTQFHVGEIRVRLLAMQSLLTEYTREAMTVTDSAADLAHSCIPWSFITSEIQEVIHLARRAVQHCDVVAMRQIDEVQARVQAVAAAPLTNDLAAEFIGKHTLGMDIQQTPRWL